MSEIMSTDTLLRDHRFKIHSRPKSGMVEWTRNGHVYPQPQALHIALYEDKEDVRMAELDKEFAPVAVDQTSKRRPRKGDGDPFGVPA